MPAESNDFAFREIRTVQDAELALTYPRLSFEQCMECIHVLREARHWGLHQLACDRAVEEGFGVTRSSIPSRRVKRAAREILTAYLQQSDRIEELADPVEAARSWVGRLSSVAGVDPEIGDFLEDKHEKLNKLLLLQRRFTLACMTPMAKLLRHFGLPALAIQAATRKLDDDPDDVPALTTRGAAFTDLGHLSDATRDHQRGYEIEPDNSYLLNAFSRTLQEDERLEEALEFAKRAFEIEPSKPTARRLVAAARALGDTGERERVLAVLESGPDAAPSPAVTQLVVAIAAEVHLSLGLFEEVEAYLRAVSNEEVQFEETQEIIEKLTAAVAEEHDRRQGRLDLGEEPEGDIEDGDGDGYEDFEPI